MHKLNITVCRCGKAKKYGEWTILSTEEMQVIQDHRDTISVIEGTCEQCLNGEIPL